MQNNYDTTERVYAQIYSPFQVERLIYTIIQ